MPSGLAVSMIVFVISMSARDGVGSPDGWLCTRMIAVADSSSARLIDLARIDRRVVDRAGLLHLVGDQRVLLVEEQDAELLALLERHRRAAIVEHLRP